LTLDNTIEDAIISSMKHPRNIRGGAATEALQQAIRDSGLRLREIARRADIDVGIVSRFLDGSRTMTLATAEKLAAALEVEVKITPIKRAGKHG
jgi:plasmid maintenance system antidote protein VapI